MLFNFVARAWTKCFSGHFYFEAWKVIEVILSKRNIKKNSEDCNKSGGNRSTALKKTKRIAIRAAVIGQPLLKRSIYSRPRNLNICCNPNSDKKWSLMSSNSIIIKLFNSNQTENKFLKNTKIQNFTIFENFQFFSNFS